MRKQGYPILWPALTSADPVDWAAAVYPRPNVKTAGQVVADCLAAFDSAAVAIVDTFVGRVVATTDATTSAAILALRPANYALVRPASGQTGSALRWSIISDPWVYGGGNLANICLPQLTKRTLAWFIDGALPMSAGYPFALVNQADVSVSLWEDWDSTTSDALALLTPAGQTVGAFFRSQATVLLAFEGGAV